MLEPLPIHGATAQTLRDHLARHDVVADEASCRRVLAHVVSRGRTDLDAMTRPVSRRIREAVAAHVDLTRPEVVERVTDPIDGSVRYLFRAADGAVFEAVRIGLHKPGRFTVCLSSQAGCAMACVFCATGRLGFGRHLTPAEIVGSFCAVRDEAPGRVTGAVFMGQGEPLHAYDSVIAAAALLSDPCGGRIDAKAITISTVGLVPQIRRYTEEGHRYRLIVSLTSAVEEKRARLLPVAGRFPLSEVRDALAAHAAATKRRVSVAWVLMGGVNDGPDEVEGLSRFLDGIPAIVHLIDVNDGRPDGFRRATDAERDRFLDGLRTLHVPFVRRYSVGNSENSACGMLAARQPVGG